MEGDLGVENYPLEDYLRKTCLGAIKSSGGGVGLGTALKTAGREAVRGAAQGAFGKRGFFQTVSRAMFHADIEKKLLEEAGGVW